ncbi:replication protein A (plasmid) [Bermanella marisrubri]|uniref:Uncharacterized protein n=1 Tax=Bermanella marisrubri TaxID=207949 RepID=Q1MXJ1_9GAMM|nr:replication initiation protein [Bermanella marisrubri]EAT10681.1 hypothetical protein RED65_01853 [Oceanobacter sp. RED65] [Bermanella marisrubri]QIZ85899.1 replication protein A [Bermanella marisrubri]
MEALLQNYKNDSALSRIEEFLPYKPFCSDNKTAALIRVAYSALRYDYIQVNPPEMLAWMVFDLDNHPTTGKEADPFIWQWEGLPPPNLIVTNLDNSKSHLYYAVAPVCRSKKARIKPQQYFKAVRKKLGARLGADPDFTSPVSKNPFSKNFRTLEIHNDEYSLCELDVALDEPKANAFYELPGAATEVSIGRNTTVFNWLRYWAYEAVDEARKHDFDTWTRRCHVQARRFAIKASDALGKECLKDSEIKAIAKSVSGWVWNNYNGDNIDRGIMGLNDSGLDLKKKQSLAAHRTNSMSRERNKKAVKRVILALKRAGFSNSEITRSRVAKIVGLGRKALYTTYKAVFDRYIAFPSKKASESTRKLAGALFELRTPLDLTAISVIARKIHTSATWGLDPPPD